MCRRFGRLLQGSITSLFCFRQKTGRSVPWKEGFSSLRKRKFPSNRCFVSASTMGVRSTYTEFCSCRHEKTIKATWRQTCCKQSSRFGPLFFLFRLGQRKRKGVSRNLPWHCPGNEGLWKFKKENNESGAALPGTSQFASNFSEQRESFQCEWTFGFSTQV